MTTPIIPDFQAFSSELHRIFSSAKLETGGQLAQYIPELARANPEHFGASVCTVDAQRASFGDAQVTFSAQSTSKPILYCAALDELGAERVHQHIGWEPSGHGFNEITLNRRSLPHNPMINAGAIMACALIKQGSSTTDKCNHVLDLMADLSAGERPGFNGAVYLSEKDSADRNYALGHFMREKKAFPQGTDLFGTLDLYFRTCSIEVTTNSLSIIAATLANAGICPLTGKRVLAGETVKHCLSLMSSCGMYDFSGEFAFSIGLPAKSGISGGLMVVVPNVLGIGLWSPRVDAYGNSVRGVAFCRELVATYNFHQYDSLLSHAEKIDPRRKISTEERPS